jgi:general secretion pathway protein L
LTTLYIRHPARANSHASGSAPRCHYALAEAGGALRQQGVAALGNLGGLIAQARRVVLLLSAADVTLLRVKVPPLSAARLRAALPNLVEERILAEPADCVLAAGAADADGLRTVAVAQRAWLELLVKALLAQGARAVAALPSQLCLPTGAGAAAALQADGDGLELTLRLSRHEGIGLTLPADAGAALDALRACAGGAAVTLYLPAEQRAAYEALAAGAPGLTIETEQWTHWIGAAQTAGPDLAPALGVALGQARDWRRWRWPLRLALLAALVNITALNLEWFGLRRDAGALRAVSLQAFKAAYPNEAPLMPAAQMRRNIALAQQAGGQISADEFTALAAALAESLAEGGGRAALATLDYRERALQVKFKPGSFDASAQTSLRAALAARNLQMQQGTADAWRISTGDKGGAK